MKKLLVLIAFLATSFSALAANTAVLTWDPVTKDSSGVVFTEQTIYTVYQGLQGQAKAAVSPTVTSTTMTISSGLLPGNTYCWTVTAKTATRPESGHSNEACKVFPPPPPPPTNLVVL